MVRVWSGSEPGPAATGLQGQMKKPRRKLSANVCCCLFLVPGILLMAALVASVVLIYRDYSNTAERSMRLLSLTARQEWHSQMRVKFSNYLESSITESLALSTSVQMSETSGDAWAHDGRWLSYLRIVNWAAFSTARWCSTVGVLWEDGTLLYSRPAPDAAIVNFTHGWVNATTGALDLDTWHVPASSSWRHCSMDACLGLMESINIDGRNASNSGGQVGFSVNSQGDGMAGNGTRTMPCTTDVTGQESSGDSRSHGGTGTAGDSCSLETWVVDGNTTVATPVCRLRPPDVRSRSRTIFSALWAEQGEPTPGDPPLTNVALVARGGNVSLWVTTRMFVYTRSAAGLAHGGYMRAIVGMSFDSYMLREDLLQAVRPGGVAFVMNTFGKLIASTHGNVTRAGAVLLASQSDHPLVANVAPAVLMAAMAAMAAMAVPSKGWGDHLATMRTMPDMEGLRDFVVDYSLLLDSSYTVVIVTASPKHAVGINPVPSGSKLFAGLLAVVIAIFLLAIALLGLLLRDWLRKGRLQRLLRGAIARMEHALQAKSMFLANMSHELRTPLCAITGYLDLLLLEAGRCDAVVGEYATLAKASAQDLLKMVNDILDLEKMSGGATHLEVAPIHLERAMQSVFALFASQVAAKRGLELVLDVSPRVPPCVCGDLFRWKQVFINLISNAIRFTKAGYIKVTLDAAPPPDAGPTSKGSRSSTASHSHAAHHAHAGPRPNPGRRSDDGTGHASLVPTGQNRARRILHSFDLVRPGTPETVEEEEPSDPVGAGADQEEPPRFWARNEGMAAPRGPETGAPGEQPRVAGIQTPTVGASGAGGARGATGAATGEVDEMVMASSGDGRSNAIFRRALSWHAQDNAGGEGPPSVVTLGASAAASPAGVDIREASYSGRRPSLEVPRLHEGRGGSCSDQGERNDADGPATVRLVCSVEDTGVGIPEDQWEAVFDSFQQVDGTATRDHGGTGLGLSLVRSIVALMGGEVKIVPKEGPGTKVRFSMLLRACARGEPGQGAPATTLGESGGLPHAPLPSSSNPPGAAEHAGEPHPPPPPLSLNTPNWVPDRPHHVKLPLVRHPSTPKYASGASAFLDLDLEGGIITQGVLSLPWSPSMARSHSGTLLFSGALSQPLVALPPQMPLCNVALVVLPGPVERSQAVRWLQHKGMATVDAGTLAEAHALLEQRAAAKRRARKERAVAREGEGAGGLTRADAPPDPRALDLGTVRYDVALVLMDTSLLASAPGTQEGGAMVADAGTISRAHEPGSKPPAAGHDDGVRITCDASIPYADSIRGDAALGLHGDTAVTPSGGVVPAARQAASVGESTIVQPFHAGAEEAKPAGVTAAGVVDANCLRLLRLLPFGCCVVWVAPAVAAGPPSHAAWHQTSSSSSPLQPPLSPSSLQSIGANPFQQAGGASFEDGKSKYADAVDVPTFAATSSSPLGGHWLHHVSMAVVSRPLHAWLFQRLLTAARATQRTLLSQGTSSTTSPLPPPPRSPLAGRSKGLPGPALAKAPSGKGAQSMSDGAPPEVIFFSAHNMRGSAAREQGTVGGAGDKDSKEAGLMRPTSQLSLYPGPGNSTPPPGSPEGRFTGAGGADTISKRGVQEGRDAADDADDVDDVDHDDDRDMEPSQSGGVPGLEGGLATSTRSGHSVVAGHSGATHVPGMAKHDSSERGYHRQRQRRRCQSSEIVEERAARGPSVQDLGLQQLVPDMVGPLGGGKRINMAEMLAMAMVPAGPSKPPVNPFKDPLPLGAMRVLVVEDNVLNQKLITRVLQKLGPAVQVSVVDNGQLAVEAAFAYPWDVIFMDCQMPVMDGLSATRAIRAMEAARGSTRPVPIVALTANALPTDEQACVEAGMSRFLAKPLDFAQIQKTLRELLPGGPTG